MPATESEVRAAAGAVEDARLRLSLADLGMVGAAELRGGAARAIRPSVWTRPGSAPPGPDSQANMASTTSGRAGEVEAWSR